MSEVLYDRTAREIRTVTRTNNRGSHTLCFNVVQPVSHPASIKLLRQQGQSDHLILLR